MHARADDGSLSQMEFEVPQEAEFEMGGGGLYGTASDHLAFAVIFLNEGRANGQAVLKPETVQLMMTNAISDLDVQRLKTVAPPFWNDAEFFPGIRKKWSLGFMISTEAVPGRRSARSLAWAGLGNTYFWIEPASWHCSPVQPPLTAQRRAPRAHLAELPHARAAVALPPKS